MDFTGKIIFALPAKSGLKKNGESWKSQEFVIENIEGQYPKKMCFNVFGEDKINSSRLLKKGQFELSERRSWFIDKTEGA